MLPPLPPKVECRRSNSSVSRVERGRHNSGVIRFHIASGSMAIKMRQVAFKLKY
jgi:hypothetical protein